MTTIHHLFHYMISAIVCCQNNVIIMNVDYIEQANSTENTHRKIRPYRSVFMSVRKNDSGFIEIIATTKNQKEIDTSLSRKRTQKKCDTWIQCQLYMHPTSGYGQFLTNRQEKNDWIQNDRPNVINKTLYGQGVMMKLHWKQWTKFPLEIKRKKKIPRKKIMA